MFVSSLNHSGHHSESLLLSSFIHSFMKELLWLCNNAKISWNSFTKCRLILFFANLHLLEHKWQKSFMKLSPGGYKDLRSSLVKMLRSPRWQSHHSCDSSNAQISTTNTENLPPYLSISTNSHQKNRLFSPTRYAFLIFSSKNIM